jgi:hypothetical protein
MKRRLHNLLTALSLLLCVAVAALWVRSHTVSDYIMLNRAMPASVAAAAWCDDGRLVFAFQPDPRTAAIPPRDGPVRRINVGTVRPPRGDPPSWAWLRAAGDDTFRHEAGGFLIQVTPGHLWLATVPCWLAAAVSATGPVACLLRRRRRTDASECRRCGYDLRATPGRCPECGERPEKVEN